MSDVYYRLNGYKEKIYEEIICASNYRDVSKDILIVVHNQIDYLKKCIQSIRKNTENYQIYIWDNASDQETRQWIEEQKDFFIIRSETNEGFIKPNNYLAKISKNPYLILLNSDTEVLPDWDKALISQIQINNYSQVGYLGGKLNCQGKGVNFLFGNDIDYIPGWCFCIPRQIYDSYGLFDEENLFFAYCEDSDLSLRLLESGKKIYALHLGLVVHHENQTIKAVAKLQDCRKSYEHNHEYVAKKYFHRLNKRL